MKKPTTLTQQELSSIKHALYDMIQLAGYWDDSEYSALSQSLKGLNFKKHSLEQVQDCLASIVDDMILWDDVNFNIEELYKIQERLK